MAGNSDTHGDSLQRTPLHAQHVALGARMVGFAGYDMPVQYEGIIAEHTAAREAAALFDVSHMGQLVLRGNDAAADLERLVPADVRSLQPGAMRYSQLTNADGGIIDDLMITRLDDGFGIVVNASRKHVDIPHLQAGLGAGSTLEVLEDMALIACQGPQAAAVLGRHAPGVDGLAFMAAARFEIDTRTALVSRSVYTGEDGYEISVSAADAPAVWDILAGEPEVAPAGLGARDSLRLEAGLCLYGHDIDETTSPVEAGLTWSIGKHRRTEGGFPGDSRICAEIANGPARRRVGIKPGGRAPVREGAAVLDAAGSTIGAVTSGGFGPTAGGPVAMGYVEAAHAAAGTPIAVEVRGKQLEAAVAKLPFVPHNYHRG